MSENVLQNFSMQQQDWFKCNMATTDTSVTPFLNNRLKKTSQTNEVLSGFWTSLHQLVKMSRMNW